MKQIDAHMLGIEQGSELLFSDFQDGGSMWTGEGARERRRDVVFSRPFHAPPSVILGISLWDVKAGANLRTDIAADAITPKGFEIVFRTWGDTRIARIRADWSALGPLGHPDNWDV